jgi:hypothetical protein
MLLLLLLLLLKVRGVGRRGLLRGLGMHRFAEARDWEVHLPGKSAVSRSRRRRRRRKIPGVG